MYMISEMLFNEVGFRLALSDVVKLMLCPTADLKSVMYLN